MIGFANKNTEPASTRDWDIARGANGKTWAEMKIRKLIDEPSQTHYLDEMTDLWIPRGVLLFRRRAKKAEPRDTMQLEG